MLLIEFAPNNSCKLVVRGSFAYKSIQLAQEALGDSVFLPTVLLSFSEKLVSSSAERVDRGWTQSSSKQRRPVSTCTYVGLSEQLAHIWPLLIVTIVDRHTGVRSAEETARGGGRQLALPKLVSSTPAYGTHHWLQHGLGT